MQAATELAAANPEVEVIGWSCVGILTIVHEEVLELLAKEADSPLNVLTAQHGKSPRFEIDPLLPGLVRHLEVGFGDVRARFEQKHVQATLRQFPRGDTAGCA